MSVVTRMLPGDAFWIKICYLFLGTVSIACETLQTLPQSTWRGKSDADGLH